MSEPNTQVASLTTTAQAAPNQTTTHLHPQTQTDQAKPPRRRSPWLFVLALIVIVGGGAGMYFYQADAAKKEKASKEEHSSQSGSAGQKGDEGDETNSALTTKVEVTHPKGGGLGRVTNQPADVHAFQYADLRSRVSGFMETEDVDIGDTVKKGQTLATIYAPERVEAKNQAAAQLELAQEQAQLAREKIKTAKANVDALKAVIGEKEAMVKKYISDVKYRRSELDRVKALVAAHSIERRMLDEEQEHFDTAEAALNEARAEVLTSKANYEKARAELGEAEAQVKVADAKVKSAEADFNLEAVYVEYLKIISPYNGVITRRTFHPGDFIRADPDGTSDPILSVARTDRLRVVIEVPDIDVPFVKRGDRAIIKIDALRGYPPFEGKVSRFASAEDIKNRTMRTEVDLLNYKSLLKPGMYGRGLIILAEKSKKTQTIPASAVFDQKVDGTGLVYVVKKHQIEPRTIKIGENNGIDIEVLEGLSADDEVVANYNGSLEKGMKVETTPYTPKTVAKSNDEDRSVNDFDEKGTTIQAAAPAVDREKGDMTPVRKKTAKQLKGEPPTDLDGNKIDRSGKSGDSSKDRKSGGK